MKGTGFILFSHARFQISHVGGSAQRVVATHVYADSSYKQSLHCFILRPGHIAVLRSSSLIMITRVHRTYLADLAKVYVALLRAATSVTGK